MEPRATSSFEKLLSKSMTIPAGIEAPNLPASVEVKNPIQLKITPQDIFASPTGNLKEISEEYEIKEEDLKPIGKVLYARTKARDDFAFQFMRDYYFLCQKQQNNPSEELTADLESFVKKYQLDSGEAKVNLTDRKAISQCKLKPLQVDHFFDAFSDVFKTYFREANLGNIASDEERTKAGLQGCKKFVQAELFNACLAQGLLDLQALKIEEKQNNPGKNASRSIGEQYLADIESQIADLENFKKRLKTPGHVSKSSIDKQSADRSSDRQSTESERESTEGSQHTPQRSPDRRSSIMPSSPDLRPSPDHRRQSMRPAPSSPNRRPSMAPPPPPLSIDSIPSIELQVSGDRTASITPKQPVEHKTPVAHQETKTTAGILGFMGNNHHHHPQHVRHRSPVDPIRRPTLVSSPPPPPPPSHSEQHPPHLSLSAEPSSMDRRESRAKSPSKSGSLQDFMRARSPFGRKSSRSQHPHSLSENKQVSAPMMLEAQADQMRACLEETKTKLNEILTKSLYEDFAATTPSVSATALTDSVARCMMGHISHYTEISNTLHEQAKQHAFEPKHLGQLETIASNVVGSSRERMNLAGCTVRLPVIKGSRVDAKITPDDIFRRNPEKVTAQNPFGLGPIGQYFRELVKVNYPTLKDEKEDTPIYTFDFLCELYQLQQEQIHGNHIEAALEEIVRKYELEQHPNRINVQADLVDLCVSERPLRLSNFAEAFKKQANETLRVANYATNTRPVSKINEDLLKLYAEQGLLDAFREHLTADVLKHYPQKEARFKEIQAYQNELKHQLEGFQKIYGKYIARSKNSNFSIHKKMSKELLIKIKDIIDYLDSESKQVDNQFLISVNQLSLDDAAAGSSATQEFPGFNLGLNRAALSKQYKTFRENLEECTATDDKKIIMNKLQPLMSQITTLTASMSLAELDLAQRQYSRKSRMGSQFTR